MAEILSQEEIDALLSALSTGDVAVEEVKQESKQPRIKKYDFRRPDKFSKEQLRTIKMIHETYARLLSSSLSASLRTIVEAEVLGADQLTYDEFIRSLPNPSSTFICTMKPLEGNVIFALDMPLSFSIIDRLLGGHGGDSSLRERELTDIEQIVLTRILKRLLTGFKEAWKNVVDLTPSLERLEMNPQFVQAVSPGDMVVLNTLELKIDQIRGMFNICLPFSSIEGILPKLSVHYWFAGGGPDKTNRLQLRRKLEKTVVPVSAIMGRTTLSVRDVLGLEAGDVIPLYSSRRGLVELLIGSRVKFLGHPGSVGKHLGVQIVKAVDEAAEGVEVNESTADPGGN